MRYPHYRTIHRFDSDAYQGRGEQVWSFRAQIFEHHVTKAGIILVVMVREYDDRRPHDLVYQVSRLVKDESVTIKFSCPSKPTVLFEKLAPSLDWHMVVDGEDTEVLLCEKSRRELDILHSEFSEDTPPQKTDAQMQTN